MRQGQSPYGRGGEETREAGGDLRFINELGPDSLHVLIRLDHLCVIIVRSSEWDVILGGHLSTDSNLV